MTTETATALDPARQMVGACHGPFVEAWAELDARLGAQVLEPLRDGLDRHREVVASVGLAGEPPASWAERADGLLEYRRTVGASLLEPLCAVLEDAGPSATIAGVFADALQHAVERTGNLPSDVPATWPEGALDPRPSDSFGRRVGKSVARMVSAARKPGRERLLPLRGVAARHLARTMAPAEDEAIVEAMAAWAAWTARLEGAWIAWADAALPAFSHAEIPDEESAAKLWSTVYEAATRLDEELTALVGESPHAAARETAESSRTAASAALEADLAIAGSFLTSNGPGEPPRLRRTARREPGLGAWDRDVAARLSLYASILAILAGASAIQRRFIQRCRDGVLSRSGELLDVAARLRELRHVLDGQATGSALRQRTAALDVRVAEVVQPAFAAIPKPSELSATVTEASDAAVEALLAVIRQAPASVLLHEADEHPPAGARPVEARPLELQELARQSFDALRIERIRSSTQGLLSALRGVRSDLEGLPAVFQFARDEALRELDSDESESNGRALELLEGAVERMAAALETRVVDLERAVERAHTRLASEIADGSAALLGRVGAGRMEAQLLAARSRAAAMVAWVSDRWWPPLRRALARARAVTRRMSTRVVGLARRVSTFLGRGPATKTASTRTIQSLAEVQALVERLPLVYQRLFTLDPISDPALLAGREGPLAAAMERWRRWHADEGVPLLIRGRQRSGITSFLDVLESQIQAEGHTCVSLGLDARLTSEEELAAVLSRTLDLECASSLDELAHAIFAVDQNTLPAAIGVDNLEHLYLRVPGGTDLAERFFTLMAETEPRIFWMGGISASAWQLVATAEPTAVSQLDVLDLPPLDAWSVREAILARHRRSGLDVHYEESITAGARLRRRLRGMRSGKGIKKLLEDEFFDQLHRASGGYLGLALFLWLQSARFDPDEGVVMSLPTRPDFTVLDQLTLTQNFTLKAFLEHRTLTFEEHDSIFRLPRHESYQILESLRNRRLIEEVAPERPEDGEMSEIEVDLRYRVRPLLTGAVISHLLARNIVH